MDNFLGIGFGELVAILMLSLFFLGPGKMVNFSRWLGKFIYDLKKASSDIKDQLAREVDEQGKPLRDSLGAVDNEVRGQTKSISQIGVEFINDLRGMEKDLSNTVGQMTSEIKEQGQAVSEPPKQPVSENKDGAKVV